jgi:hypothetical protein
MDSQRELTTQHNWVHAVKAVLVTGKRHTFLTRPWRQHVSTGNQPPIQFALTDNPVDPPPPQRSKYVKQMPPAGLNYSSQHPGNLFSGDL